MEPILVRIVGAYEKTSTAGETVNAVVPKPLPPSNPPLVMDAELSSLLQRAEAAVAKLKLIDAISCILLWKFTVYSSD